MPISYAERVAWSCSGCGVESALATWRAVDVVERPDLCREIARGSIVMEPCPQCDRPLVRPLPLLLTRLGRRAPVVVGVSDETDTEPLDRMPDVVTTVRKALGAAVRDVPGPALVVTFDVISLAAGRDVDADVERYLAEGSDAAEAEGTAYAAFLWSVVESEPERQARNAIERLRHVDSRADLERLVDDFPEIDFGGVRKILEDEVAGASAAGERDATLGLLEMVDALATGDPAAAWEARAESMRLLWGKHSGPEYERLVAELAAAEAEGDLRRVVSAGREVLAFLPAGSWPEVEGRIASTVADALGLIEGSGRSERQEEAIALYRRALELLESHPELDVPARHGVILGNLGTLLGSRIEGDPRVNLERSIASYRDALRLVSAEVDGDGWALIHTNLALALINRSEGNDEEDLDAAIFHLEAALSWRSYDRNPLDWAYTQINLGLVFARRRTGDRRDNVEQAIAHCEEAKRGALAADHAELLAQAEHNLASECFVLSNLDDTDEGSARDLRARAESHAWAALAARPLEVAPEHAGRTWALLADVLWATGRRDDSLSAYQAALEGLKPFSAPRECREAARKLADLATEMERLDVAADAWETAAEAALVALSSRAAFDGRLEELRSTVALFRFAAHALARGGRATRAVEILEQGRGRELGVLLDRDAVDLETLERLDPGLHAEYVQVCSEMEAFERSRRVGADTDGIDAGAIVESFRQTVARVRRLPGLESVYKLPGFSELGAAARPEVPVVYLVCAPTGSTVFLVSAGDGGRHGLDVLDVPGLTSQQVAHRLLGLDDADGSRPSFVIGQQTGDPDRLDAAIADLRITLGEHLLGPVAAWLDERGAQGVCLIPTGLLGLVPLHAVAFGGPVDRRCLLDDFDVVFTPSGMMRAACLSRAEAREGRPRRLVAVGNPLPHAAPLPGAEYEARLIAEALESEETVLLIGEEATREAVVSAMGHDVSHLHFACHGGSGFMNQVLTAGLSLANGERLGVTDLLEFPLSPRLVVASACESGVIQGYETIDESLGLSSAFLGAGAAGVVSTLWSVDDLATALLMTRFYESLRNGEPPAGALRAAQCWLRDLSHEDEEQYIEVHPNLVARRASLSHRRGEGQSDQGPYSAPNYWAPFMLSGA